MYLVDTNVVSETRKARPHGGVMAWLRNAGEGNLNLAAVTLAELQTGIEITRERDPPRATEIEAWVDQIARTWNVLPMDTVTFRLWARLMHRRSEVQIGDTMIAATAIVHRLRIVTRNVRDFRDFDIEIIDPFAGPRALS